MSWENGVTLVDVLQAPPRISGIHIARLSVSQIKSWVALSSLFVRPVLVTSRLLWYFKTIQTIHFLKFMTLSIHWLTDHFMTNVKITNINPPPILLSSLSIVNAFQKIPRPRASFDRQRINILPTLTLVSPGTKLNTQLWKHDTLCFSFNAGIDKFCFIKVWARLPLWICLLGRGGRWLTSWSRELDALKLGWVGGCFPDRCTKGGWVSLPLTCHNAVACMVADC